MALPEATFDESLAVPYFPRPVVKYASLVPIPGEFPAFIQPEWDDTGLNPQVFFGDYYLILNQQGRGRYGSARAQWENMHKRIPMDVVLAGVPAMAWVKVLIPLGYHIDQACELVTMIPTEDGTGIRESRKALKLGTLVLRQPGGEFQFVRPEDEAETYYSADEARSFGLTEMSADQFAEFAVATAMRSLVSAS